MATTISALSALATLQTQLQQKQIRFAAVLDMPMEQNYQLIESWIEANQFIAEQVLWVGGQYQYQQTQHIEYKQANQVLGQEFELVIFDCAASPDNHSHRSDASVFNDNSFTNSSNDNSFNDNSFSANNFNANSFNAVCGTLKAGGFIFLVNLDHLSDHLSTQWLRKNLHTWLNIDALSIASIKLENALAKVDKVVSSSTSSLVEQDKTQDQQFAIEAIEKVMTGHRKRPLLLSAHRGRGKSSTLGMAAAHLMLTRGNQILVTAPNKQAVSCVFDHAYQCLRKHDQGCERSASLYFVKENKHEIELSNGARLSFIAPDALLHARANTDLLLVDEAAALPLPSLLTLLNHYHRMVLSTTLHGYEGSGLGMVHKLHTWLDEYRLGWKHVQLIEPIRWQLNDVLEKWQFETFFLTPQILASLPEPQTLELIEIDKAKLIETPEQLAEIVNLLVGAHYQTTPNDIWQWLDDARVHLYQVMAENKLYACAIVNEEGGMDDELAESVMLGKRRPTGHLVPVQLGQHLSCKPTLMQQSVRIMRIAVMPQWQNRGIGTRTIQLLKTRWKDKVDYLSTSFGATPQLIKFWARDFKCVRLGNHKDQVSGCFSAVMICPLNSESTHWFEPLCTVFEQSFYLSLSTTHSTISSHLVLSLVSSLNLSRRKLSQNKLFQSKIEMDARLFYYAQGGSQFESIHACLATFLWQYIKSSDQVRFVDEDDTLCALIKLVLQHHDWAQISMQGRMSQGRKHLEAEIRRWLTTFMTKQS